MSSGLGNTNVPVVSREVDSSNVSKQGQITNALGGLNQAVGAYSSVASTLQTVTGMSIPGIDSNSTIGKLMNFANDVTDITSTADSLVSGNLEDGSKVLLDSTNPQPAAFKWVQLETVPGNFVSSDSVILFVGEPIYGDNAKGAVFTPIGVCQTFTMSCGINVSTIQELRCEENLIIPGRTQPVNINISRLCGNWSNMMSLFHGDNSTANSTTDLFNVLTSGSSNKWSFSPQYSGMRKLFGLYIMVLDTSRQNIVQTCYVERCAITNFSLGISAGNMQVVESCSIIGGRIIDPNYAETSTSTDVGTSTEDEEKNVKELSDTLNRNENGDLTLAGVEGTEHVVSDSKGEESDINTITNEKGEVLDKESGEYVSNTDPAFTFTDKDQELADKSQEGKEVDEAIEEANKSNAKLEKEQTKQDNYKAQYNAAVKEGDTDAAKKWQKKIDKQESKVAEAKKTADTNMATFKEKKTAYTNKVKEFANARKTVQNVSTQSKVFVTAYSGN